MNWDITDVDKYYRTPEGILVADILASELSRQCRSGRISALSDTDDQLAIGYPFPLYPSDQPLPPVFMLADTGVLVWTKGKGVITACIDSDSFPCGTEVFERVFVCHALEHVADKAGFLSEIWRCLKGEGELVVIVPHRRSLWARADKTPFGQGTPFSQRQLKLILEQAGFDQIQIKHSLHMPPFGRRLPVVMRRRFHVIGRIGWAMFGGVLIAVAKKRLFFPHQQPSHALRQKVRQFIVKQPAGSVTPLRRNNLE